MEMNVDIIRLSEVLKIMADTTRPFDIVYVTADERRKTGGEIKARQNCRLSGPAPAPVPANAKPVPVPTLSKNPNHFQHATRNIIKPNGQVRTVHIFLILQFNGKKVII